MSGFGTTQEIEVDKKVLVELRNLTVPSLRNQTAAVLENVNWTIREGDFWVVLGPTGCGKTALLITAAGLIKPLAGSCVIFGNDMGGLYGDEHLPIRKKIGFVYSNGGRLFRDLTLLENVMLPICYHEQVSFDQASGFAVQLLELMELGKHIHFLPGHVDFSARLRTGLARALALRPELLFVDDVASGMDQIQINWWISTLDKLNKGSFDSSFGPITIISGFPISELWKEIGNKFGFIGDKTFFSFSSKAELAAFLRKYQIN
jgi:ABC-type transporter Mla maintaining outer membrane lipid asymmetry ATPase subunit MlaF